MENSIEDATIVSEDSKADSLLDRLNTESDALEEYIDKHRDALCDGSISKHEQQVNSLQLASMLDYQRCLKTKIDLAEFTNSLKK